MSSLARILILNFFPYSMWLKTQDLAIYPCIYLIEGVCNCSDGHAYTYKTFYCFFFLSFFWGWCYCGYRLIKHLTMWHGTQVINLFFFWWNKLLICLVLSMGCFGNKIIVWLDNNLKFDYLYINIKEEQKTNKMTILYIYDINKLK